MYRRDHLGEFFDGSSFEELFDDLLGPRSQTIPNEQAGPGPAGVDTIAKRARAAAKLSREQLVQQVTEHAHELATLALRESNEPDQAHLDAVKAMIQTMVEGTLGVRRRRVILPLPTGTGKTTSVKCVIRALFKAGLLKDAETAPIAVACERVEAFAEMVRDLIGECQHCGNREPCPWCGACEVDGCPGGHHNRFCEQNERCGYSHIVIPEEMIGVGHSKMYNPRWRETGLGDDQASIESTKFNELPQRAVVFFSHARVRNQRHAAAAASSGPAGSRLDMFTLTEGGRRRFVIWDEALFTGDAVTIKLEDLEDGLWSLKGWLRKLERKCRDRSYRTTPYKEERLQAVREVVAWAEQSVGQLLDEKTRQVKVLERLAMAGEAALTDCDAVEPCAIRLEFPDDEKRAIWLKHVSSGGRMAYGIAPIRALLQLSPNDPIRVLVPDRSEGGDESFDGLAQVQRIVSSDLDSIVVLDGTAAARRLQSLDPTLEPAAKLPQFQKLKTPLQRLKDWSDVRVRYVKRSAGKQALSRSLVKERKLAKNWAVLETAKVIREAPPGQVLIFVHKASGRVDYAAALRAGLQEKGIDLNEPTPSGEIDAKTSAPNMVPRVEIATWGQHEAQNRWRTARTVVLLGIMYRDELDIYASAIAQLGKPLEVLPQRERERLRLSEVVHAAVQAISRGRCRQMKNGKALAMDVWLVNPEPEALRELIDEADLMPGARWEPWLQTEGISGVEKKLADAADLWMAARETGDGGEIRPDEYEALVQDAHLKVTIPPSPRTIRRALALAAERRPVQWKADRQGGFAWGGKLRAPAADLIRPVLEAMPEPSELTEAEILAEAGVDVNAPGPLKALRKLVRQLEGFEGRGRGPGRCVVRDRNRPNSSRPYPDRSDLAQGRWHGRRTRGRASGDRERDRALEAFIRRGRNGDL
jgi:hypothetical protein